MHSETHQILEEYLRIKRLRPSRQRIVILEKFLEYDQAVSAIELYIKLKSCYPGSGIGQATVFRTLKLLVSSGIAISYRTESGPVKFLHDGSGPDPGQQVNQEKTDRIFPIMLQKPNRAPKPARVAAPRHKNMTAAIP